MSFLLIVLMLPVVKYSNSLRKNIEENIHTELVLNLTVIKVHFFPSRSQVPNQ